MGAIISSVIATVGLVVVGVFSAIASGRKYDNPKDCKKMKKANTWMAVGSILLAILCMLIMIFAL